MNISGGVYIYWRMVNQIIKKVQKIIYKYIYNDSEYNERRNIFICNDYKWNKLTKYIITRIYDDTQ